MVHVRRSDRERRQDVRQFERLVGPERRLVARSPADPGDRDLGLRQNVRRADRPVAAAGQDRPGPLEAAERVLAGRPLRADEGHGQEGHLVVAAGPQGLDRGHRSELTETRQIGRVHELEMGERVAPVGRPVGRARRGDRIEALAHRPVAERMEVDLESGCVEPRDDGVERARLHEAVAAIGGRPPVAAQVGLEHRGGEVLDHAVLEDLDARRSKAAHRGDPPALDQLLDLLGAAVAVPTLAGDRPAGQLAPLDERAVRGEIAGRHRGVLPGGDAEAVQVGLRPGEAGAASSVGGGIRRSTRSWRPRAGFPMASRRRRARCARRPDPGCPGRSRQGPGRDCSPTRRGRRD